MERNKKNVLSHIENSYADLRQAERKVAKVILERPAQVVSMNISDLSNLCDVSDATVVRMAQNLGYKGYHQMRLLLSKDKSFAVRDEHEEIENSTTYYFKGELSYLNSLLDNHTQKDFDHLVDLISESQSVVIVGVGNAVPITSDLDYRLNRIGCQAYASTVFERTLNYIHNASADALVIAVSKSGMSTRVLEAVQLAQKKELKTVAIVGDLSSPIAKQAGHTIYSGNMHRFVSNVQPGIESYIGEYLINDLIIMTLSYLKNKENIDYSTDMEIELSADKL